MRTRVRPEDLTDMDFLEFSRLLRHEMDSLDGAAWQDAQDLRDECRRGRVYNSYYARRCVADAINARSASAP